MSFFSRQFQEEKCSARDTCNAPHLKREGQQQDINAVDRKGENDTLFSLYQELKDCIRKNYPRKKKRAKTNTAIRINVCVLSREWILKVAPHFVHRSREDLRKEREIER
jgi:hypothetical protein